MIVQGIEVVQWVSEKTGIIVHDKSIGIGYVQDRIIIAGVSFEGYMPNSIIGHQRIDKPAPKGFWVACADYAYNKLGVKRITGLVDASNEKAIKINYKLGYELEATLKQAGSDGGDLLIMVMWRENCNILKWHRKSI